MFRLSGTAAEFTELLCISRGRLKALLEEHPAIGVKLLQCFLASLSEKIMRSNELRKKAAAYDHNAVNEIWRSEHGDFCRQMKHRSVGHAALDRCNGRREGSILYTMR